MNIEKKLDLLREAAMEEARAKGNAIIKQHENALNDVFNQHKQETLLQKETRIKAERISAKQQLNMASSKAQLELKKELSSTQLQLKKKLFVEVRELLDDYMKTPAYENLLINYIQGAARYANGASMTIYINPSDEGKMAHIQEVTGMKLTLSSEDFIGGVRCVIQDRNILIDHAFKDALETEYENFAFKGGGGIE
ncbi:vacuolar-type H+-ATPase subunit E/Vma4 [Aequitasia blattaphilus]|uniref:V-type ATP synthase subunit E n=1 Tax=Aequitasia blattaphilus TaxID=2949332 RepID=A0ABT1E5H1_9FIRM|nr:V-type ATP synthase subunit E [Aequitasia blattaphilus]MCP1100824.1 V-type ATP synthase subunit E [Aequitasia blattaphilus]MCR8613464.1 V-type ATP synthase subunit E [Aequitasia blattaphilus]